MNIFIKLILLFGLSLSLFAQVEKKYMRVNQDLLNQTIVNMRHFIVVQILRLEILR